MMVTQLKIFKKWKLIIWIILVGIGFVLIKYRDNIYVHSASSSINYFNIRLPAIENFFSNQNMPETSNFHDLELYLRMYHGDLKKYKNYLIRSMRYFWPGNVSMVIVLDAENAEDRKLGQTLPKKYPYPRRMQMDFFYPETKVKRKYIGFLDTDTVFVTRPVIIANYGEPGKLWWNEVAQTTAKIYKAKEIMRCMSFFPVIIQVEHVVKVRKYIENPHGKPFDEVFKQFSATAIGQFNSMCQYLWNFHRDEYKFYFHVRSSIPGEWNGKGSIPEKESFEFYKTNINDLQKVPKARSSIHYRYHDNWKDFNTYKDVVKKGICYSGGFDLCPEQCKQFNRTALQKELFYFEANDWSWDPRCVDEQKKHYAKVDELRDSEAEKALQEGCAEVDKLSFK
ncbi:hypothetical protein ACJMK2_036326 [Sinanodonta woodiana]|uniref:Uncharacterized protein n=1 Tax=Sinanodonta woodiana TaxID=1069815 RepID=A0ABD3WKF2_SINWO